MIVAFIGKVLTGKIERENFDESLAVRRNSSDFSTVKVLRYTVPDLDEEVIASWSNPTQSDSRWQVTVQMARQISAHLVFQLSVRYVLYIHTCTCMYVHTYMLYIHICICILSFRFNQVDTVVREVATVI